MEIEIKNFGPIDHLKFDLNKDLHILYGQNAVGKSYATYCLYSILKNIKNKSAIYRFYFTNFDNSPFSKLIKSKIKELKANKTIDISTEYSKLFNDGLKDIILNGLQNSLLNTFSSLQNLKNRYSNKNYELIISLSTKEKLTFFSNDEGKLNLKFTGIDNKIEILLKNTKSTKYSLIVNDKKEIGKATEDEFINSFIYNSINNVNS